VKVRGVARGERLEEREERVFIEKTPDNKLRYNRDIGFQ